MTLPHGSGMAVTPWLAEYLSPRCAVLSLDVFAVRTAILNALNTQLAALRGTVLDIGCGNSPYKSLVLAWPSRAERYIGLDVANGIYQRPDLQWDGRTIPLDDRSVDCALATEVFEHCPDPGLVMRETYRVLKTGGLLFLTVPFLWPLHDVPHDEYRYTPFALRRHLGDSGFTQIELRALGGWDASLSQMIALWVRRREMAPWKRRVLSICAVPFVAALGRLDEPPEEFHESAMITGLWGTARKTAE